MARVLLIQVAIADYRDHFISQLRCRLPGLSIQVGDEYFEDSTRTSATVKHSKSARVVRNAFLLGRRLCWQRLRWSEVLAADAVVGELNPRVLSMWIVLLLRKALSKRTLLWGHAWSRKGAASSTEGIRHCMRRLADGLIFYTETQRREFIARYPGFGGSTVVAPNALYRSQDMSVASNSAPTDFIYVGRLVETKKVALLLEGFKLFSSGHRGSRLHIVGSGDQRNVLVELARGMDGVVFHGHVSDADDLRRIYAGAVASVSPGYVGLSVTQSLSFGVPMIIARDEPHSPEIECLVEGFNGSFFDSDSARSLCEEMERWREIRTVDPNRSAAIVEGCRVDYSVERMVDGFMEAIQ